MENPEWPSGEDDGREMRSKPSCKATSSGLLCCLKPCERRWGALSVVRYLLLFLIVVIVIVFIIVIVLALLYAYTCPERWVKHLGKCYYFSEDEADWTSSQSSCSTLRASLAVINTQQEMDFLRRYGGPAGYWIGLHRELGQPWKWTSGTEFNKWFTIAGEETCAFMDDNSISSSSCSNKQRWICSK